MTDSGPLLDRADIERAFRRLDTAVSSPLVT